MVKGSTSLRQEKDIIYYCDTGTVCGGASSMQVGKLEHYSYTEYDNFINANDEEKSAWALKQNAKLLPANDNDYNGSCDIGSTADWGNYFAHHTQNWKRTDLTSPENQSYAPSSDLTSEVSTSLSVSAPAGISVSTSVDHPELKRNVDYEPDEQVQAYYDFFDQSFGGGVYDAYDSDSQLGQASSWTTDRPSSGDRIAPSYLYAEFNGVECDGAGRTTTDGDNLFLFFEYADY
ncbi:hypothetical protein [Haloferax sp. DFSO60]|uniref:hypothetical protein n=1 Tax=Haloferax sp. DFSO60 TaxID=3388652 RepID=UPI00397E3A8E